MLRTPRFVRGCALLLLAACEPSDSPDLSSSPSLEAEEVPTQQVAHTPITCRGMSRRAVSVRADSSGGRIETLYAQLIYPSGGYDQGERILIRPVTEIHMILVDPMPRAGVEFTVAMRRNHGDCFVPDTTLYVITQNGIFPVDSTTQDWAYRTIKYESATYFRADSAAAPEIDVDIETLGRSGFVVLSN